MRKIFLGLLFVSALALPTSALAGQSGISGSLYDATCGDGCLPSCPPPCRADEVICAQRPTIVCPQARAQPAICLPSGCGTEYPLYEGEDATITVRRVGSADVMRTVAPRGGHFHIRLGPGRYALRGHVAQPCWVGEKTIVTIAAGKTTAAALDVRDNCVMHPDAAG